VLDGLGLKFQPLTEVEWTVHRFKSKRCASIRSPDASRSRRCTSAGRSCTSHRQDARHSTTRLDQERVRRLLKEVRHYAHMHIHEVLADLVMMQKRDPSRGLHDDGGTVAETGPAADDDPAREGHHPRAADSVAITRWPRGLMGFDR